MAPKVKEDEKLERTIRGLLKHPDNRRCINCNSLGPQYVCTTFCTFICTNCSGIHREFTHRVKSISMAKFTSEEVTALQAGGNERARQIYLKEWDPERHSHPDSSNLYKLRDFIKHVYVDRKFSGERSEEKLPRLRLADKEESYGSRSSNACRSASGSPRYEDRYERPYSGRSSPSGRSDDGILKYYYDERRSPRYAREVSRYGGYRRSPVRFEVVDDRFRDDTLGSGRRTQGQRLANEESRLGSRSPENQKNMDKSTPTVTRPAKEIVTDAGPSLRVGETMENSDGCTNVKKVRSLDNLRNTNGSAAEMKEAKSQSLIECSTDEKPPDASAETQRQQTPSSTGGGNWASFAPSAKEKAPSASSANTLEMLLLELTPAVVTVGDLSEGISSFDAQSIAAVSNTSPTGIAPDAAAEQTTATADVPRQQASALADAPATSSPIVSTENIGEETPQVAPESSVDLSEQLPSTQQCQPPASPSKDESAAVEKNEPLVTSI
ncbi:probable ADP-ribosylation factor GTPase-activating protein AGD14 [Rhodamnia argentea]|uniref:Probable ADP-ribosylation factor GTPase-activating protein AGD14 n=1 Tax=Rhodamnia argentea TaxID=178133 RepID=A0ABM3HA84_9MYRT|nr:probable ADP-ribosylation factor GTPase-activating protein AGD14 [Rhodamnia argentea]